MSCLPAPNPRHHTPATARLVATELIALPACFVWARSTFGLIFMLVALCALAGCSALPDKPLRAALYDFGPGQLGSPAGTPPAQPRLAPLAIDDIATAGGALDNTAVLYRLAYRDAQQLRPYTQARWAMPPAQLVRQRLRERLSERRTVFVSGESAALNRDQNAALPRVLRLSLEEFSHLFTAADTSVGLVRLRASLFEITPAGEKFIGQHSVVVQRPAPSADAPGGVRALSQATDAAIDAVDQWLQQLPGG